MWRLYHAFITEYQLARCCCIIKKCYCDAQAETNTMSAVEHDVQKGDDAVNYSALNLNKHFLEKLKEAGRSPGT